MSLLNFEVSANDAGLRLDQFLAVRLGSISRMRIARILAAGACSINGLTAASGNRVAAGDMIRIDIFDPAPTAMTPESIPLDIVYEDGELIVVVKPAGMLVHPTLGVKSGTLANALAYYLNREDSEMGEDPAGSRPVDAAAIAAGVSRDDTPILRPGIVHRLDRATSGLMVIAKTQQALSVLSNHFRRRLVEKRYVALLHGQLRPDSLTISAPIGRDPQRRPQWSVMESGRPAETRIVVLDRTADSTLVELEPVTGRTNQLRIHCCYRGHSIVGDDLYNGTNVNESPHSQAPTRLFLHAWRLSFRQPRTGDRLDFHSPLPVELESYLRLSRELRIHD